MRCSTFGQVLGVVIVPAHVNNDSVVLLNIIAVGRNVALPDGASPFTEYVTTESEAKIGDSPILQGKKHALLYG